MKNLNFSACFAGIIGFVYMSLNYNYVYSQCTISGNKGTSCEYEVQISFSNPQLLLSPNGGNTVARLEFDYNVSITKNPCNFNGNFYTLQGVFNSQHSKVKNSDIFFDLENNVGNNYSGTTTSSNFVIDLLYPATLTIEQLAPTFTIEIHGPGIQTTFDCSPFVSPLPVELISFDVDCENNKSLVNWATASEQNNEVFNIYKSTDGIHWELITSKKGNGNSNVLTSYSVEVPKENASTAYYRLEQIDFSGRATQYQPIAVNCTVEDEVFVNIYPNPIMDVAKLQSNHLIETIRISDLTGKTIAVIPNIHQNEYQLMATQLRNTGIYIAEIILENGFKTTKKIVLN